MDMNELQSIVLKNTSDLREMRDKLDGLASREQRATAALAGIRNRIQDVLSHFDRDGYKTTDQRLLINALAVEILVFDELGYELRLPGARFLLGIDELLEGRNAAALARFGEYLAQAERTDLNLRHAHYLAGMICYNRRDFAQASEHFRSAFLCSPENARDWQSLIYVAALQGIKDIPVPQYPNVSTFITDGSGERGQPRDLAAGLLAAVLGRLTDSLGASGRKPDVDRGLLLARNDGAADRPEAPEIS